MDILPDAVKDIIASLSGEEMKPRRKRKKMVDEEYVEKMGKGRRPEDDMEEMEEEYEDGDGEMEMKDEDRIKKSSANEYEDFKDEAEDGDDYEEDEYEIAEGRRKPRKKNRLGFSMLMEVGKGKRGERGR